jgi:hypothetical protein
MNMIAHALSLSVCVLNGVGGVGCLFALLWSCGVSVVHKTL